MQLPNSRLLYVFCVWEAARSWGIGQRQVVNTVSRAALAPANRTTSRQRLGSARSRSASSSGNPKSVDDRPPGILKVRWGKA
jgi:hypothetical protein